MQIQFGNVYIPSVLDIHDEAKANMDKYRRSIIERLEKKGFFQIILNAMTEAVEQGMFGVSIPIKDVDDIVPNDEKGLVYEYVYDIVEKELGNHGYNLRKDNDWFTTHRIKISWARDRFSTFFLSCYQYDYK